MLFPGSWQNLSGKIYSFIYSFIKKTTKFSFIAIKTARSGTWGGVSVGKVLVGWSKVVSSIPVVS